MSGLLWYEDNKILKGCFHADFHIQSILVTLVVGIWLSDFLHTTPYRDLLPPNSMFFSHPFRFLGRWIEVYDLHVAYVSEQTAEKRRKNVEDVQKRSEYRKAHGMDQEGIFGSWTAKSDTEIMGPALREGDVNVGQVGAAEQDLSTADGESGRSEEDTYMDFEGNKQPVRKKWFGIW